MVAAEFQGRPKESLEAAERTSKACIGRQQGPNLKQKGTQKCHVWSLVENADFKGRPLRNQRFCRSRAPKNRLKTGAKTERIQNPAKSVPKASPQSQGGSQGASRGPCTGKSHTLLASAPGPGYLVIYKYIYIKISIRVSGEFALFGWFCHLQPRKHRYLR